MEGLADLIDGRGVFALLNAAIRTAGGNNAFADANGVHKTTVSNWAHTHRYITDKMLDVLGLERVVLYRPKRKKAQAGAGRNG